MGEFGGNAFGMGLPLLLRTDRLILRAVTPAYYQRSFQRRLEHPEEPPKSSFLRPALFRDHR